MNRFRTSKPPLGLTLSYANLAAMFLFNENGGQPRNMLSNTPGAFSGTSAPTWQPGEYNGAIKTSLAGSGNSLLNFGTDPLTAKLAMAPGTLIARINPLSVGANSICQIAGRHDGNTAPSNGWVWLMTTGEVMRFEIERTTVNNTINVATTAVTPGKWQTIAVSWSGANVGTDIKFYIDGRDAGSTGAVNGGPTTTDDSSRSFYIGSGGWPGLVGLGATYSWLAAFRRQLSPAEIQLWSQGTGPWHLFPPIRRPRMKIAPAPRVYTIEAVYSGSPTFKPSSGSGTLTVTG